MQTITTVTQKGQITIPKQMRDMLNISPYNTVQLEIAKNHIKIKPAKDILDLAGSFKPRKKKPIMKARDAMEKYYKRF